MTTMILAAELIFWLFCNAVMIYKIKAEGSSWDEFTEDSQHDAVGRICMNLFYAPARIFNK